LPGKVLTGTGIMEKGHLYSWFKTSFDVPTDWPVGNRVVLNFGAVDYEATVFVNGNQVGFHRGGYFEFSFDVTDYLSANSSNELYVFEKYIARTRLTSADWFTSTIRPIPIGSRFP
jgi:beta-galactosidase/beta-glucuronidase